MSVWEESAHNSSLQVQASGLCLVLLSKHQDAFHSLSDGAKRLQAELQGEGTSQVVLTQAPSAQHIRSKQVCGPVLQYVLCIC